MTHYGEEAVLHLLDFELPRYVAGHRLNGDDFAVGAEWLDVLAEPLF